MPEVTCVGLLVADVVGKPIDSLPGRGKLAPVDRMELHTDLLSREPQYPAFVYWNIATHLLF